MHFCPVPKKCIPRLIKQNEKTITWPKTDVLKVGHHGSDTSSSKEFLEQVNPKYSIIMVGEGNTYKLPKQPIIDRIEKQGSKIYRTDKNGNTIKF